MILDKARSLAAKEKQERIEKDEKEKAERIRKENLLDQTKGDFRKMVMELDEKDGFEIRPTSSDPYFDRDQYVNFLYKDNKVLGGFYIHWDSYKFKGSDEAREETINYIKIGFREVDYRPPTGYYREGERGVEFSRRSLKEFGEALAEYLKRFY